LTEEIQLQILIKSNKILFKFLKKRSVLEFNNFSISSLNLYKKNNKFHEKFEKFHEI